MAGLTADNIRLYVKDLYKVQYESYNEQEKKYDKIFKVVNNVNGGGDKESQLLGAGALTRHLTETQEIEYKSPVSGWDYYTKYWTFSDGIALSKNAVEDTVKLGNYIKDLANSWGKQVTFCKENFGSRVFNEGGNLSGDWIFNGTHPGNTAPYGDMPYDNKPIFNLTGNKRTTKGGGTYYNSVAGATVTASNFETLYNLATATNNKDERDNVMKNTVDTLLTRPGADRFAAERILGSNLLPTSQLNDVNPYYKLVTPMDWDYLEAAEAAFFIGKKQHEAWQFRERQAPEIRFFRDEKTLGYNVSINIRIGILIKDFRPWVRGGGTSA